MTTCPPLKSFTSKQHASSSSAPANSAGSECLRVSPVATWVCASAGSECLLDLGGRFTTRTA